MTNKRKKKEIIKKLKNAGINVEEGEKTHKFGEHSGIIGDSRQVLILDFSAKI